MFFTDLHFVMSIGTIIAFIIWLVFYSAGNKHAALFDTLNEKEYPLKELYGMGYAFMQSVKYEYKSNADRTMRQQIEILYGKKYADFYIRVIYAQKTTFALTLFVVAFVLYGLTDDIISFIIGLFLAGLAYYYFGSVTGKKITKRSEELLRDFCEAVSKMALLTNAGMILREVWEEVAYSGNTPIYLEMQRSVEDMKNGVSETEAVHMFGSRCLVQEIKKFSATVIQGIEKGNRELSMMLKEQSKELWELKKQDVKRQGEKANSKLLIPIVIMFLGILIMVMVPIFANLGI